MRAEQLRRALLDGPLTREDVCRLTGLTPSRVMVETCKLRDIGCTIEETRTTVLDLVHDPAFPERERVCRWPGCDVALRKSNPTGFCGCHVHAEARRRYQDMSLAEKVAVFEQVTNCEADEQLAIEAVIAP